MATRSEQLLRHIRRLVSRPASPSDSDAALLGRFVRHHDQDAFVMLVRRHGPLVLGVCRRVLGDAHAAEDAAQAVFLVLARKATTIRPPDRLAAWLHGVAHHLARNARRADGRRRRQETRCAQAARACPPTDPLDELTARELLNILDEELQRLPEVYRLPVILCCLEGRSQEQAAAQLGWTPGSVKGRLERGRAKLHGRLARRGVTLPAALLALDAGQGMLSAWGMPAGFLTGTLRAAAPFASGVGIPRGTVASAVVALVEEGIRSMAVAKPKLLLALLLAAGVAAAGVGTLARQEPAEKQLAAEPKGEANRAQKSEPQQAMQQARTDRSGDPLPEGAVARMGTVRFRHGGAVRSVAFSPDGKTLASGAYWDNATRLWEAATGKELHRFVAPRAGPNEWVMGLAFSPDGKTLATAGGNGDETIHLWEVATGKELLQLRGHQLNVLCVTFSPNGKVLATGGADQTIRLWDSATGKEVSRLPRQGGAVGFLAFSPDGKTLAAGGQNKTVLLWEVATGKEVRRLVGHQRDVSAIAFRPDGKTLASAGEEQTIHLWEVTTGKELRQLKQPGPALSVAFSPDGRILASAGADNIIRLWEPDTGKELHRFPGGQFGIGCVTFSPDGRTLAAGGADHGLHLWEVATGKQCHPFGGHQGGVCCVALSPDARTLVSGGSDGTIRLWDATTGRELCQLEGNATPVLSLAFSPAGKLLASGGEDGTILLWEVSRGRKLRRLGSQRERIQSLVFTPDGDRLISGSIENRIHIWEAATGKELRQWPAGHETKHQTNQGVVTEGGLQSLALSPNGEVLASAGNDGTICFWEVAAGRERLRWKTYQGLVTAIAFSPDGRTLISGGAGSSIRLWEVGSGKQRRQFEGHRGLIRTLAFAPDGMTIAGSGDDAAVHVWEVATGKELRKLRGHRGRASSVAYAADGKTLASGSMDTTALVWNLRRLIPKGRSQKMNLSLPDLATLWSDLLAADASRADQAIRSLIATPGQAVSLLGQQLRRVPSADSARIARLIADLDSDQFAVREKATHELEELGGLVEPSLRKALSGRPSIEVRRRLTELLEKTTGMILRPEQLRVIRAMEVLEQIGTPEAKQVLAKLAQGSPQAHLTREAKASLERLAKRSSGKP